MSILRILSGYTGLYKTSGCVLTLLYNHVIPLDLLVYFCASACNEKQVNCWVPPSIATVLFMQCTVLFRPMHETVIDYRRTYTHTYTYSIIPPNHSRGSGAYSLDQEVLNSNHGPPCLHLLALSMHGHIYCFDYKYFSTIFRIVSLIP
jgi:hypothetical protein